MDDKAAEIREKVRQQFETGPYPRIPLETSPKNNYNLLFYHSLVTAYYLRNKQVIETEGKVILDAGCGTGYKALALAEANPGAKIVCIDLSEESLKLAQERLHYYGFENSEFYQLTLEELPSLGIEFDYINNDEVLYVLADPVAGLKGMKSVLKPGGIIRTNLHSSRQRTDYYRAQELFKVMALMDENPREVEMDLARDTMKSLKDGVLLKAQTWKPDLEKNDERILMNYLFQGDKGYTILEMFSMLKAADLEFVSMVNWREWDLMELFQDPDNLPVFLAMTLPELSVEQQLHLFELLHPINRLLDFWCGHPSSAAPTVPVDEWTQSDWQAAKVHLHPQLRTPQAKEDLIDSITNNKPFHLNRYFTITAGPTPLFSNSSITACLLPLWEKPQSFTSLVQRWLQIQPRDPISLEPVSEETATEVVKRFLKNLESFLYVLLQRAEH